MLRRLRLPGKLTVAVVPLVVVLVAASALLVTTTLEQAERDRETAALAASWDELTVALAAISAEEEATLEALGATEPFDLAPVRETSDAALDDLEAQVREAGAPASVLRQLRLATDALAAARSLDVDPDASAGARLEAVSEGFEQVEERLLQVGDLIPAEVADRELARSLAAVAALGHARDAALGQEQAVLSRLNDERAFGATVEIVRAARSDLDQSLAAFEGAAPEAYVERYRSQAEAFDGVGEMIDLLIESPINVLTTPDEEWQQRFDARQEVLADLQTSLTAEVIADASAAADAAQREALAIAGGAAGGLLLAGLVTILISRSVVRRVRDLTDRARHVTREQLPALVEALRDPGEEATLPSITPLRDRGADEVGELARSFAAMQSTLEHVADQQLEVLRKGVADIFVTLARRNRSLVDRQLSLLDQLEAGEEDPEMLGDLYRLDHLATRMRRNAESLLVLAGTESPRTYHRPLQIDDVIRAALGEVEDYRRIDILTLEPLEVTGRAVADLSHLLSELCENATAFSPPGSRVRVAGHFHDDGYLITITDRGVGISEERLAELNRLLASPPVVGLALEPTLGLYVVAMLARRHGLRVRLVPGAPGTTAHVVIPPTLFEVRPAGEPARAIPAAVAAPAEAGAGGPLINGTPPAEQATDGARAPTPAAEVPPTVNGLPTRRPGENLISDDEPGVEPGARVDPTETQRALSSFQTGMAAARKHEEGDEDD